ncbi:hypothetical protein A3J41_03365 [candidate division TM6 bacterium RIFCSPHIGHO2_12_FULL_38_8]|nr:MAG: hypothetical protein A3J41_03365 [candidate division TM6 bacterium RIFCSPHIGHO2_12_FULL_38_8]
MEAAMKSSILKYFFATIFVGLCAVLYQTVIKKSSPQFASTVDVAPDQPESVLSKQVLDRRAAKIAQMEEEAMDGDVNIPVSFVEYDKPVGHVPAEKSKTALPLVDPNAGISSSIDRSTSPMFGQMPLDYPQQQFVSDYPNYPSSYANYPGQHDTPRRAQSTQKLPEFAKPEASKSFTAPAPEEKKEKEDKKDKKNRDDEKDEKKDYAKNPFRKRHRDVDETEPTAKTVEPTWRQRLLNAIQGLLAIENLLHRAWRLWNWLRPQEPEMQFPKVQIQTEPETEASVHDLQMPDVVPPTNYFNRPNMRSAHQPGAKPTEQPMPAQPRPPSTPPSTPTELPTSAQPQHPSMVPSTPAELPEAGARTIPQPQPENVRPYHAVPTHSDVLSVSEFAPQTDVGLVSPVSPASATTMYEQPVASDQQYPTPSEDLSSIVPDTALQPFGPTSMATVPATPEQVNAALTLLGLEDQEFVLLYDIEKHFRRLAREFHPDMPGGNKELFQALAHARDIAINQVEQNTTPGLLEGFTPLQITDGRPSVESVPRGLVPVSEEVELEEPEQVRVQAETIPDVAEQTLEPLTQQRPLSKSRFFASGAPRQDFDAMRIAQAMQTLGFDPQEEPVATQSIEGLPVAEPAGVVPKSNLGKYLYYGARALAVAAQVGTTLAALRQADRTAEQLGIEGALDAVAAQARTLELPGGQQLSQPPTTFFETVTTPGAAAKIAESVRLPRFLP